AVWHLNDNKQNLGSHVDRHEHIGRGRIGLAAFRDIMRNPAWTSVAKIIETPKGDGIAWDRRNLDLLRRLAGSTEDFPAALSTEWEV
ncbi:MAG TPA: TIM barrel protein, partial [Acidobacteriota bacterium]|nr:TIM barrel protein [Acidobacteriota bacterium]